ncbi:MAG: hypothetical protein OJF49_002045 [Ktedonobacterales bacterium]|nr:MAG: hypothetical protein OJF49_002045 [Ktedonobacterales bacterium]
MAYGGIVVKHVASRVAPMLVFRGERARSSAVEGWQEPAM